MDIKSVRSRARQPSMVNISNTLFNNTVSLSQIVDCSNVQLPQDGSSYFPNKITKPCKSPQNIPAQVSQ